MSGTGVGLNRHFEGQSNLEEALALEALGEWGKAVRNYEILVRCYGNNSARWTVPTTVLFVRDKRAFLPEDEFTRQYKLRLLADKNAVLLLGKEEF